MTARLIVAALCCGVFLSVITEGAIRVALLTSIDRFSGTDKSVCFRAHGDKDQKTMWMCPDGWGNDFERADPVKATFKQQKSIGDLKKLEIWVKASGLTDDDWKAYKVILSDYDTKKAYFSWAGAVETGKIKALDLKPMTCSNKSGACSCDSHMDALERYKKLRFQIDSCPLMCKYCFDPKARDENISGEGEIEVEEGISGSSGKDTDASS